MAFILAKASRSSCTTRVIHNDPNLGNLRIRPVESAGVVAAGTIFS
jgi:hypothetical protein